MFKENGFRRPRATQWPFFSANKDKLRSFQEQFIDDPFTGTGGTRLAMTTGRLNA